MTDERVVGMHLQAGLTVKYGKEAEISALVTKLVDGMEQAGWRLDLAYRPASGDVRQVTDLWDVPDGKTVVETLEQASRHPGHAKTMDRLSRCLDGEVLQLMEPTAYSPSVAKLREVTGPLVEQRLRIVYAAGPAIGELIPATVEAAAAAGWQLVTALRPVLGDFTELLHLWQLPDIGAFDAGRAALRSTEYDEQLASHIVDERLQLLERMSYSP